MSKASKPHREQVAVTHMDLIQHRLSTKTDKPNGTAWFNAYQIDARYLIEQLEARDVMIGEITRRADHAEEKLTVAEGLRQAALHVGMWGAPYHEALAEAVKRYEAAS